MMRFIKLETGVAESGAEMLNLPTRREASYTHRSPCSQLGRGAGGEGNSSRNSATLENSKVKPWLSWLTVRMIGLLGATVMLSSPAIARSNRPTPQTVRAILQQRIDQEKQSVGIVVGLIDRQGQQTIGYGRLSQTDQRQPNGDTVFEIGSITKVFTALVLADMAERGELKLTDPISKFLPKSVTVPTHNGKAITLIDLATHTSGLPRLPDNLNPQDINNPYADYTIAQLNQFLSSYKLTRDIGKKYEYSNLGMGLLGHLLSLKAGIDYETLIKTRITQPGQMSSTAIKLSPTLRSRLATGHDAAGNAVTNWDLPTLAGAGALRSTANDLLQFLAAHQGWRQSTLAAAMRTSQTRQRQTDNPNLAIGLGWHILNQSGTTIISHDGGTGGYRSFIGFNQTTQLGVVVLANSSNDINDIGMHLLDAKNPLIPRQPPLVRQVVPVDANIYDAYVGHYELTPEFILTITKQADRLYLQATGQPQVELWPSAATEFFIKEVDAQVTFVKSPTGAVDQLILHQNGQHLPARRLP
jgi:serine-type D-Ala-D-Ala carboxypeptidase/endopeptidase